MSSIAEIRKAAEDDLETFIRLVAPYQVLGSVHQEWCRWSSLPTTGNHQLTLLPRDHGKSRLVAFKVAWMITRRPDIRILYISSTANLAEKQLGFVKQILGSNIYKRYWPEMLHPEEGKREKWSSTEIMVDHPKRKEEGIRDPTVFCGGLSTNLVGMHCDIAVLDDTVVHETAYTEEGRNKIRSQYSLLSSIESADAEEWVVGTRYHAKDLYNDLQTMEEEIFNEHGDVVDTKPVYACFERQVEDVGDGTGQFLWPRQQRADGKWFGFDKEVLARKRAKYLDKSQFRAQYYNDPNDPGDMRIGRDKFQYYDPKLLHNDGGQWYYKDQRLNVFASVDFAYSLKNRADYTAIAVVGINRDNNVYVLEIDRFKTDRIPEYFEHILALHNKWQFKKMGAEVSVAQKAIVRELKEGYIKPYGLYLSIEEMSPTRHQGSKQERMAAILEPRYDNMQVWHYRGGHCQTLEDELIAQFPPHDDCMDSLAAVISISVAPHGRFERDKVRVTNNVYNTRFGGLYS